MVPQDETPGSPINAGQSRDGQLLARASAVIECVEVSLFPQLTTHHVQEVVWERSGHGHKRYQKYAIRIGIINLLQETKMYSRKGEERNVTRQAKRDLDAKSSASLGKQNF